MLDEEDRLEAERRILPCGWKPEDYAIVGEDMAIKIASLVAKEYIHIQSMRRKRSYRDQFVLRRLSSWFSWFCCRNS